MLWTFTWGPPRWLSSKGSTCQYSRCGFKPWVRKIPWRRKLQPTPVFLPGESHGQRSLEGCSSGGCTELDTTERLSVHARSHARMNIQVQVYVWIYVFNSLGQQPRSQTAWPNGNYVLAMLCCRPTFSEYSGLPAALRSRRSLDSSSGSPRIGSWLHHSPAN